MTPPERHPSDAGKPGEDCLPPVPPVGAVVPTACGGTIVYNCSTPCTVLKGQRIFFCLAVCKTDFDRDPRNSCVAIGPYSHLR